MVGAAYLDVHHYHPNFYFIERYSHKTLCCAHRQMTMFLIFTRVCVLEDKICNELKYKLKLKNQNDVCSIHETLKSVKSIK